MKAVSSEEQIMSEHIFCTKQCIVFIILFEARAVLKIREFHSDIPQF